MTTTLPRHHIDTHPDLSGQLSVHTILYREGVTTTDAARAVLAPLERRSGPRWLRSVRDTRQPSHAAPEPVAAEPFAGDDDSTVEFPRIVLTAAAAL